MPNASVPAAATGLPEKTGLNRFTRRKLLTAIPVMAPAAIGAIAIITDRAEAGPDRSGCRARRRTKAPHRHRERRRPG